MDIHEFRKHTPIIALANEYGKYTRKKKKKVKISYVRKVMPNKASKINGIFNSKEILSRKSDQLYHAKRKKKKKTSTQKTVAIWN